MGSWSDLDATYPPGTLTPATALVVALSHLASVSMFGDPHLPVVPHGLGYDADLRGRVERYLAEVPLDSFLAEAHALLTPRQRLVLALQLLDHQLATGDAPEGRARLTRILVGIGADMDALAAHRPTLALKHDLSIFPQ